jgi:hypothetical protein
LIWGIFEINEEIWKEREAEYLNLLKQADERYWALTRFHKQNLRDTILVWIAWSVILLLGFLL